MTHLRPLQQYSGVQIDEAHVRRFAAPHMDWLYYALAKRYIGRFIAMLVNRRA
jgi:hypothetical protein